MNLDSHLLNAQGYYGLPLVLVDPPLQLFGGFGQVHVGPEDQHEV
jgi:hypothetical protein